MLKQTVNSSNKGEKRAIGTWRFASLMAIAFLFGLYIAHATTRFETTYWYGNHLELLNENGEWVTSTRNSIGNAATIQQIRFRVQITNDNVWTQPIGLIVGGPFSAEIYWDDELIGRKGQIGSSKDEEIAGPIDSVTFVPSKLLSEGEHEIRLRISTEHLARQDDSVVHSVILGPYRHDERRELRYYSTPLVILSALIALTIQNLYIGRNAGNALYTGLSIFGLFMIIGLMAEVSRAVISYPYYYHELRGLFVWIANIGAGLSLNYLCLRLRPEKWVKFILLFGLLIVGLTYLQPMTSGDVRLAQDFILLSSAPSLVYLILWIRRHISFLTMLPLFWLACLASIELGVGLFLDSYQFLAALILLLGGWLWTYFGTHEIAALKEAAILERFEVKSAGRIQYIPVGDVSTLKSEGNYTVLSLNDGRSLLHQDGLGDVLKSNPRGFVRVHRSYAVNVSFIKSLRSAEGSKYWLELVDGDDIPVSRYRVAEIREALAS